MSKKYLLCESNGIGKEYDDFTDNLIIEGEYLKGEKKGKGIEYYRFHSPPKSNENLLQFEGKYINEKKQEKEKKLG